MVEDDIGERAEPERRKVDGRRRRRVVIRAAHRRERQAADESDGRSDPLVHSADSIAHGPRSSKKLASSTVGRALGPTLPTVPARYLTVNIALDSSGSF